MPVMYPEMTDRKDPDAVMLTDFLDSMNLELSVSKPKKKR